MVQLGQQHGLCVLHGFHLDGEVLSDVSEPEWRYCPLPQQVPKMEWPEIILPTLMRNVRSCEMVTCVENYWARKQRIQNTQKKWLLFQETRVQPSPSIQFLKYYKAQSVLTEWDNFLTAYWMNQVECKNKKW
jgi:hypothetical protein